MRKNTTFALACHLLAIPAAVVAQDDAKPIFVESVDVDVINVEVFATDKSGRPVHDLEAEDFEVFEDGEPVEITNFFTTSRTDRVSASLDRGPREIAAEGLEPAAPLSPLPEDQTLHLVIYVDHFNLRTGDRRRVLDDLGGFVEDRLIQGDRIMLVGYDRQLEVAVPFTRDRERLLAGIEGMRKVATHRPIDDAERLRTMRLMTATLLDGPNAPNPIDTAYQQLRSYVQSARSDLRFSAKALSDMVRSLAGLPGRKAVLYVSSGLPQRPGEELYQHLLNLFGSDAFQSSGTAGPVIDPSIEALREDESHLFTRIIREANSHQVTLYTLDARGGAGESTLSAEFATLTPGDAGRTAFDQIRTHNLQEPLMSMAVATGGRAILDTYNFDGVLIGLADDFDTFYSLGYRPARGRDGKYHKIKVEVKRPGVRVRHRAGYESKPEIERVGDRTMSSLLLGLEKNPHDVRVDFGKPEPKGGGKFELQILIRVPIDKVTLIFQEESAEGRLQFFLAVQDEEGISDLHRQSYPVTIPADQLERAKGREIAYAARLKIRKGTPNVAVGVWDELSGEESFVHTRVRVEKSGKVKKKAG